MDDDTVFYVDGSGAHGWKPPDGEPVLDPTDPFGLIDVASRNRAYQIARHLIQVDQGFFDVSFQLTGAGAQLSPDGDYVLTRVPDDGAFSDVLVYDTRSGEGVPTGLTDEDVAVAAALGRNGDVTYVVARAEDRPAPDAFLRSSFSGQLELRSCDLDAPPGLECESLARFPSTGSLPLVSYGD